MKNWVFVGPNGERELVYITQDRQKEELGDLHPKMHELLFDAVMFAKKLGWQLRITSIYRTHEENENAGALSTIHCQKPHRAVDIGALKVSPTLIRDLDKHLDDNWVYDPMRPKLTCSYETLHGTGPHIHLQVSPATRRRQA